MNIRNIRMSIASMAQIMEQAGAKSVAGDFYKFCDVISGYDDLTIGEFSKRLAAMTSSLSPKASTSLINQDLVASVSADLLNKSIDIEEFTELLQRISGDKKQISNPNLYEIAKKFIGADRKFVKRETAITAMREKQIADLRATNKAPRVSDIF